MRRVNIQVKIDDTKEQLKLSYKIESLFKFPIDDGRVPVRPLLFDRSLSAVVNNQQFMSFISTRKEEYKISTAD